MSVNIVAQTNLKLSSFKLCRDINSKTALLGITFGMKSIKGLHISSSQKSLHFSKILSGMVKLKELKIKK